MIANEIEILDRRDCLELVRRQVVGRYAVAPPHGPPLVVPVNFVLDDETVVVRTRRGGRIHELMDCPASFQVDGWDGFRHIGWSVLLQGTVREISPEAIRDLLLEPWVPDREVVLRLVPTSVTGRRIPHPALVLDERGYV
jgi:nitroimidazol reductase NimA-like FMN-containing flavoprotein (pyridoxamine 5'-phosphate oxidase superfamily)